jgi:eukaryotic-like serine/threonine-protein kinase
MQPIHRRTMILGLGLAGLAVMSGRIAWLVSRHAPAPLPRGTVLHTYRGHSNIISSVAWSPDGRRIASGSDDGTVQVSDAADAG